MSNFIYLPILKGKRAEFKALSQLSPSVAELVRPLIEIEPVPYDPESGIPEKSYSDILSGYGVKLAQAWTHKSPMFIDGLLVDDDDIVMGEIYPLKSAIEQAREEGVHVIPVSSPTRSKLYQSAVKDILSGEICLRLGIPDLMNPQLINSYINDLGLSLDYVDVIIDLNSSLNSDNVDKMSLMAAGGINNLPNLKQYRSVTLAAGSFPKDLSDIDVGIEEVLRLGWILWKNLRSMGGLNRPVIYGDYGIQHPDYARLATRFPSYTASIRYTADEHFLVFRGRVAKTHGFEQYGDHCKKLIQRQEYSGKDFSYGDKEIWDYAHDLILKERRPTYGNAEVWRRIGANHHITKVVSQVLALP